MCIVLSQDGNRNILILDSSVQHTTSIFASKGIHIVHEHEYLIPFKCLTHLNDALEE